MMIDFQNATYFKLTSVSDSHYLNILSPILATNEKIISSYKGLRDGVVFTTSRILAINVQGITGQKIDISSLSYKNIQAFSVETAGIWDNDCELELWFSGLGKVKFEFAPNVNISRICFTISSLSIR